MKSLLATYGKYTFDEWDDKQPSDLSYSKTDCKEAWANVWRVDSYRTLLERVAFLGAMNKRLTLYFRGQSKDVDPIPAIFRDKWAPLHTGGEVVIAEANREWYFKQLAVIGSEIYEICKAPGLGLPRWRGLRDIDVIQWAVIQHYGIWPTPLIDITSNLRVAASFAFNMTAYSQSSTRFAYLYVVGLPYSNEWIESHSPEGVVLARLQSACPPIARRPHFQEGFLAGASPLNGTSRDDRERSRLARRLVAKFELRDSGSFWDSDFPVIGSGALLPDKDALLDSFRQHFGPKGAMPVRAMAENTRSN